jgi:hypothetical protein
MAATARKAVSNTLDFSDETRRDIERTFWMDAERRRDENFEKRQQDIDTRDKRRETRDERR